MKVPRTEDCRLFDQEVIVDFVEGVLLNVPTFLALAVGALSAVTLGKHYPAVALRTLCGCAWLFGVYLLSIAWHTVFEPDLLPDGGALQQLAYLFLSALEAIGFAVLISAVFAGRYPANYRRFLEPDLEDEPRSRHRQEV
jgi:hypothetical protein